MELLDRHRAAPDERSNVADLTWYPELRFIDRFNWLPLGAYGVACFAVGGLPGLLWGFVVSTLAVFHCTMLINSLGHVWGSRRYATSDDSRNNALLAVLTLGEGWHNNHHRYRSLRTPGLRLVGGRRDPLLLRTLGVDGRHLGHPRAQRGRAEPWRPRRMHGKSDRLR